MIPTSHHKHIGRSLSYNDLKKRRMLRSNTNQGKINMLKDNIKDRNHEENNQYIQSSNSNKHPRINDKINFLPKLVSITKDIQTRYEINEIQIYEDIPKQLQISKQHYQQKTHEQYNLPLSQKNQDLKKLAIKPLSKKSPKQYNITTKIFNLDQMKKLPRTQTNRRKQDQSPQILKNYNTNPPIKKLTKQINNSEQNFKQKQNIFFDTISPIQEKKQKISTISKEEISGFSILLNIQPGESKKKQEKIKQAAVINYKVKPQQWKHRLYLLQPELKIPKRMKKHLPKDFFLRV